MGWVLEYPDKRVGMVRPNKNHKFKLEPVVMLLINFI